jgi:hypothetical protein
MKEKIITKDKQLNDNYKDIVSKNNVRNFL